MKGRYGTVAAFAVYDNKLIVAGEFRVAGGAVVNHIAAWDGQSWSSLGTGLNAGVQKMENFNDELVAIGEFDSAGGIAAQRIATWDGNTWAPLGSGFDTAFHAWAMVEFDGKLVVAGVANLAGSNCWMANSDGQKWSPMTMPDWAGNSPVSQLAVYHGMLVSIGYSYDYTSPIALWNGHAWSDIGLPEGMFLDKTSGALVFNDELIVSGQGGNGYSVISWDGISWSWKGKDLYWATTALASDSTKLYVANGTVVGGDPPPPCGFYGEVHFLGDSLWWGIGVPFSSICGAVCAMRSYQGDLVIGGDFTTIGSKPSPYISVWRQSIDADGDGISNSIDNCPNIYNPDQNDTNYNHVGDACEDVCCNVSRAGDVNNNGTINLLDITYLISYLYKNGPEPPCKFQGDTNGNGAINLLDITYLISYLYKHGPAPNCP